MGELDNLRKADEFYKKFWEDKYQNKMKELEKREEAVDQRISEIKANEGKYVIAKNINCKTPLWKKDTMYFYDTYVWYEESEAYKMIEAKIAKEVDQKQLALHIKKSDWLDEYLTSNSILEIWAKKRSL